MHEVDLVIFPPRKAPRAAPSSIRSRARSSCGFSTVSRGDVQPAAGISTVESSCSGGRGLQLPVYCKEARGGHGRGGNRRRGERTWGEFRRDGGAATCSRLSAQGQSVSRAVVGASSIGPIHPVRDDFMILLLS